MNKTCFRVIFNAARAQLIAVAETVGLGGHKKAPRRSGAAVFTIPTRVVSVAVLSFALWCAWGAVLLSSAQAQVIADPGAPANQRPTVLSAPNGVPLVNIQTPSAAGVSRNTYSQFDVQQQGAILNNSRTNVQTQLGGWVQGNPWLATGSARVILNEVNSANPSLLRGYVEVAGQRAQVVIANPAGVTCDGCGFINANRATLTTGTPVMNAGNLESYRVQNGSINITGGGLDTSTTDYTDLIARFVQVNGGVWAKRLNVTAGANEVQANSLQATPIATATGTGTSPGWSIDVAQLGGMYAGHISLVATEAGVGVRQAGQIGASAGDVVINAQGQLHNLGQISSNAQARLESEAGVQNSGTIYAQSDATVSTRGNLDNSGLIAARGNVSLQASGAQSQINNTNTGILAAGLESNGSLANTGQLTVSATQGITASGRHFSGGDQSFSSRMVDLSGSQTSARQLTVTATQDDVNLSNSTVLVSQTLNVNVRQTWRTDAANISAQQITASAHTLSNELGQIVQTGSGDLTLNLAGLLNNNRGRIAVNSANLDLNANTLNNANGSIEHAGTGNLSLNATTIEGTGGSVASNGVLNLMAASATLDAATTLAQQININSTTLQHRAGKLTQTGSGATILTVSGQLDNSNGLIISNGATTLTLGHLNNQGGVIQTAGSVATPLTLNVVNSLDNSQAGNISAKGSVNMSANHLNNHQGQINAGQTLTVTTPQQIDNSQGVLVANGAVNITASQISNQSGLVGSVQEGVQLTATSGTLNNLSGRIEAAQTVSLTARGINNTDGSITGKSLSADSQNQQFDNTRGRLLTTGTTGADSLNLQTAGFNNDRGLIQAASALTLDTQGQTLTNTNAGSSGGIVGQSAVNLITGDINNQAGYIGSTAALTINAAAMANNQGGSVVSSGNLTLNAQSVNNQGGQVQALSHVQVTLNGSLENSGGVVRSGQDLGIQATSINNSNTQGSNQGLEGNNVNLTVPSLDNSAGAIRANNNVILSSSGSLNNSQGLMSAGHTLTLQDAAVSKTLAITNTGGTLLAGQQLTLDGARLSGDGDVLSEGHLNIQLRQSLTNTGRIVANGNATVETTATLTNRSTLAAGNQLHAKAATLDNQAGGSISAARVKLEATSPNTLINRGLINGVDTILETQTLNNLGTGKIYGDTIAIGATTVTNGLENGVAPVIAARNRLDIGAVTIENQENAMLFSAGDLAIGGSLDANKRATGQATTLNNASGTIEALGNADISAKTINNTNLHFRYETQVESVQHDVREDLTSRQYRVFTRTISSPVVTYSKPAQLIVGGNLRISTDGAVQNYMSHIVSGGVLTVVGGSIENIQVYAPRYVQDVGTTYTLVHIPQSGRCGRIRINCRPARDEWWTSGYDSTTSTTVPVLQTTTPQGSGTQVVGLTSVSLNASPGAAGNASGATQLGQNFTPITQVTLPQGSNATGPATVVRSGGINTSVPNSRLFSFNPNPTGQYFIETDPQFANYRNWLSSNYMLNALALDPAATQKRLGDGFYEQKLIREQIAQLTGRRLLDGYADDESQYSALMNQGVTFARAHQLVPGVALSAEQMAQLTSDIVWLVTKTVTLADGSTTQAWVPQVYVRVQEGDLKGNGALIAGQRLEFNLSGNLNNSGALAGRQLVSLNAENINNLGGRITAANVGINARTDLNNEGGRIDASNSMLVNAGRDLNVSSTTRSQSNAQGHRTHLDRVAGLYVTGGSGTLVAQAGRDLNLTAAEVVNTSVTGGTVLAAGNQLKLDTVTESSSDRIVWNASNWRNDASRSEVGTRIQTQGDLTLVAGQDLQARAAELTSTSGQVSLQAGRDISLTAGQSRVQVDEAHQHSSRGAFSKRTTTTRDTLDRTTAIGTSVSGQTVQIQANRDVTLTASQVISDQGTMVLAGRDLTIQAGQNTHSESHFREEKKSGFMSSGGFGFTVGKREQSTDQRSTSTTAAASTVGSIAGDVRLQAGNGYRQVGSDVLAPAGDINIVARKVDIIEARETSRTETETKFRQSGLTVAVSSPVISAIQTAQAMSQASKNTSSGRMKALAAANTALSARSAAQAVQAGQGTTVNGKDNQIVTKTDNGKPTETRDANAADKVGGINISISVGSSSSQSKTTQTSDSARGSTVQAGNHLTIVATGGGADSDITVQGSALSAGRILSLYAQDQIQLQAAQNSASQQSSNSSKSSSLGVSFGTSGLGVTASASRGRGNADGSDLTYTHTQLKAGEQILLSSGGDTTLKGAVVQAPRIDAQVGGHLLIQSLQDTSTYTSQQKSSGGSITVGTAGVSGSVNAGKSNINSQYTSVTEQSGLRAGDGGFNVNVQGNTRLVGGAITSTQAAIDQNRNTFQTAGQSAQQALASGTLTVTDLHNQASYSASSSSVNLGTGFSAQGKLTPQGTSAGFGKDSGQASSVTQSAISGMAGNTAARTGDAETGINKIFDADRVQKEINAQTQITQLFLQQAPKAAAEFANNKEIQLRQEALKAEQQGQTERAQALKQEAERWADGGAYRIGLHAATGALAGGLDGALGAGTSAGLTPILGEKIAELNLPEPVRQGLTQVTGTLIGASVGGTAGAATALGETANNYLSRSPFANVRRTANQENARLLNQCGTSCTEADFRRIDAQVAKVEQAATLAEISQRNTLTPQQAQQLTQVLLELLPVYGTGESLTQLITGKSSVTQEEASRFWAAVGMVPVAGGLLKLGVKEAKALMEAGAAVKQFQKVSRVQDLFGKTFEVIPLSHTAGRQDGELGEQLALQLLNEKTTLNFKPLQNASNWGCDGCAVAINGDTITIVVMDAKSSQRGVGNAASAAGDPRTRLEGWLRNSSITQSDPALARTLENALQKDGTKVQGVTVKVGLPAPGTTGVAEFKVQAWPNK